jgi:selenocysteine-specific elongation factor
VLGFIDVPGHERFVHNMLAGATGIDAVLLVIAANEGIMPQTVEHLRIVELLGIDRGVIALTKADLAGEEMCARRTEEVRSLLAESGLVGAEILPVSVVTGEGIAELKSRLAAFSTSRQAASGHPRLAIDRSFTLQGTGLIVTGTLFSGEIREGDRLMLSPKGVEARVRGLHAQNRKAESAGAGERCALNISGARLAKDDIARGDWILAEELHAPTSVFDIRLKLLATEKKPLKHWTPVHVHLAATHSMGRIALLEGETIEPGGEALAQVVLDSPIGALAHDRLILRDQSAQSTIGGGSVVDPFASTRNRRKPERLIRLSHMARPVGEAARQLLANPPGHFEQRPFAIAYNLRAEDAERLWGETDAVVAGPLVFGKGQWIAARQALIAALGEHHQKAPEQPGLQPERLRNAMRIRLGKEAFAEVLAAELKIGGVAVDGPWLRLPAHVVSLSKESEAHWRHIENLIRMQRFRPPRVRDLAHSLDIAEEDTRTLMRRVARMGRIIEVAHDHFFLRETVAEMIRIAADIGEADASAEISAAAFRDRIDSGRKVAIQILEFFDKQGITIRRGDRRRIRPDRVSYFGEAA